MGKPFIDHEETSEERTQRWERAAQAQFERNPALRQFWDDMRAAANRVLSTAPQDWGPDDWNWAIVFAKKQDAPEKVREKATHDLAMLIDFKFVPDNPEHEAAKAELRRMAAEEGANAAAILKRLQMEAVHLALGEADTPQYMRFGREWAKDESGRREFGSPNQIDPDYKRYYWNWFNNKVCRITIRILLDTDFRGTQDLKTDSAPIITMDHAELDRIPPDYSLPSRDIHEAMESLSPRLAELAELLKYSRPNISAKEIAAEMGCSVSTASVLKHKLTRRFEKLGLKP